MEIIQQLLQYILHIDVYLVNFINSYGNWAYILLFIIIFCETGLVVTPFLPGDSLLFAAGSLAANSLLNIRLLFLVLVIAAISGNKVNYLIGKVIGPKIFSTKGAWFFNKRHLAKGHAFYEKHGGKTIILSRFVPIVRTFVPFIAGVSAMSLQKFTLYNITSALLWVGSLLACGYFLGSLPIVRHNFSFFVYTIVLISVIPSIYAFLISRYRKRMTV